jgi:hypothetical protein
MKIGYVFWGPHPPPESVLIEPKRHILKGKGGILKCPAHQSINRNTFEIISPYDISIKQNGELDLDNTSIHFDVVSNICSIKPPVAQHDNTLLFEINTFLTFFSDKPTIMKVYPHNFNIMEGEFNIYSWFRPLNITIPLTQDLEIKRGDILGKISFHSKNFNELYRLKKLEYTKEIKNVMKLCGQNPTPYFQHKNIFNLAPVVKLLRPKKLVK